MKKKQPRIKKADLEEFNINLKVQGFDSHCALVKSNRFMKLLGKLTPEAVVLLYCQSTGLELESLPDFYYNNLFYNLDESLKLLQNLAGKPAYDAKLANKLKKKYDLKNMLHM